MSYKLRSPIAHTSACWVLLWTGILSNRRELTSAVIFFGSAEAEGECVDDNNIPNLHFWGNREAAMFSFFLDLYSFKIWIYRIYMHSAYFPSLSYNYVCTILGCVSNMTSSNTRILSVIVCFAALVGGSVRFLLFAPTFLYQYIRIKTEWIHSIIFE